jgi:hypothetical protein
MTRSIRLFSRLAAVCFLGLCATSSLAQYTFRPIALSNGTFDPFGFDAPVLNNSGQVAFNATLADLDFTTGIFRSDGASLVPIALRGETFSRFGSPTINDAGQVGFEASFEQIRGEGIFRGAGGPVTPIAGTRNAGDFDFVNAGPSLNAAGRVAFIGERIVGGNFIDGVWAGDGGAVSAIYDTSGDFNDFIGNPSLNDSGTAAFLATLDSGAGGLFVGSGGTFITVADDSGIFTEVFGFGDPSLNERGDVAFTAGTNPDPTDPSGSTATGVFLYINGALTTVIEGDFSEIASLSDPSLNNEGEVAFLLSPDFSQQFLLTGSDLTGDRVIATGDLLLGRRITNLLFSREGLNDNGQIAFTAFFEDGSSGVFLATPGSAAVPEPGTFALLVSLAIPGTIWLHRRSRPAK